ncbi:hypothetical protein B0T11DRAFT_93984 [Plectosphaerella cucumerina]|uniref:Uncharacterized protein n=1 Tax=Plectosphaerella cucumerina TaxID=40658 RepID=A0A8K0TJ59_9PEZI|nr:hypothetical protein B0T11DRAFT_93984 [Plectosphaerella cucumerina]
MGKRQLPSSAEIAASLRQTESASKRRDAISYFGKAIRKADLFQPTWDAVGGAQGLAKTMSEFSLRDLDSMCSCLGQSSGAMGAVTERRAALAELVKTLYDDTYDVRPVHSYYKNIIPACDHQVFEAFEAQSGVQWTRSQKKRVFFTHRDELRPKFLVDLVSPEGEPVSF